MRALKRLAGAATIVAGLGLVTNAAHAQTGIATATAENSAARINARIIAFADDHPDDLVGLDRLAYRYTGRHVRVGLSGLAKGADAVSAQREVARRNAAAFLSGGIPSFSVTIVATPLYGPPSQYRVTGRWNFPNDWAGQAAPVDLAALTFQMPSCMRMVNYSISTYTYDNVNTHRGSLRSTSGFTGGLWNVSDYEKGFVAQADHGGAGITVQNYCKSKHQVGAAFDYEANQGGSVVSVSVAYGFFSVSYNHPGLIKHLGTAPVYFTL